MTSVRAELDVLTGLLDEVAKAKRDEVRKLEDEISRLNNEIETKRNRINKFNVDLQQLKNEADAVGSEIKFKLGLLKRVNTDLASATKRLDKMNELEAMYVADHEEAVRAHQIADLKTSLQLKLQSVSNSGSATPRIAPRAEPTPIDEAKKAADEALQQQIAAEFKNLAAQMKECNALLEQSAADHKLHPDVAKSKEKLKKELKGLEEKMTQKHSDKRKREFVKEYIAAVLAAGAIYQTQHAKQDQNSTTTAEILTAMSSHASRMKSSLSPLGRLIKNSRGKGVPVTFSDTASLLSLNASALPSRTGSPNSRGSVPGTPASVVSVKIRK